MTYRNIWYILKKELREMFRDKKSLAMMLIIPILIPVMVFGLSFLLDDQTNIEITQYNKIGFAYEVSDIEKELMNEMKIDPVFSTSDDLVKKYENGDINLYITKDNNIYTIHSDDTEMSTYASLLVKEYFNFYLKYLQRNYLESNNLDSDSFFEMVEVVEEVTKEDNFYGSYIMNYSFLFILMAITVSTTYPATDTTAGEKERGTLETLLTFPIKSRDIIIGKFLGVSISSIITGILSLVLALVSLYFANDMFSIYDGVSLVLSIPNLIIVILIIISYSLFISGLSIAIASKSKTFKEAQSALTPLTFISFFPGMIAFMVGIETTSILACIPFLNYTLIFMDMTYEILDITNVILMFVSTIIYISIVLYLIIHQYKSEKVLFSN